MNDSAKKFQFNLDQKKARDLVIKASSTVNQMRYNTSNAGLNDKLFKIHDTLIDMATEILYLTFATEDSKSKSVNSLLNEWGLNEGVTKVLHLVNLAGGEGGRNPNYGHAVIVWRDDTNYFTYEIQNKGGSIIEQGPVNIPGHPVPMNVDAIRGYFKARGFLQDV